MKKIFVVALFLMLFFVKEIFGFALAVPQIVGNGTNDTVIVAFTMMDVDTVELKNLDYTSGDSLVIHRIDPGNNIFSIVNNPISPILVNIDVGRYELRFARASNSSGTKGAYRVFIMVRFRGRQRGATATSYTVTERNLDGWMGDVERGMFPYSNCNGCNEIVYSRIVGSKYITDSIKVRDNSGNIYAVKYYKYFSGTTKVDSTIVVTYPPTWRQ